MDDQEPLSPRRRWLVLLLTVPTVLAVVLTLGRVLDPIPAFAGAVVATLVLGLVAVATGGAGGITFQRPGARTVLGIVLWIVAVGTVGVLASLLSDFGSP